MEILLDSAIIKEAKQAASWGWVRGATTNPTLLANSDLPPAEALAQLAVILKGPIFYQLTANSAEGMLQEANLAHDILGEQLVLKIPACAPGFQACVQLSQQYRCAFTAVYSPAQALLGQAAGAHYILYYHNRAKRLLKNGEELAAQLVRAVADSQCEVIAASLKSPEEMAEARLAGVKILSAKFSVLQELPRHELSEQALEEFAKTGTGLLA